MKPGTVFVYREVTEWRRWRIERNEVLVVLDSKSEVHFWNGGLWAWGDVSPGSEFEVLL